MTTLTSAVLFRSKVRAAVSTPMNAFKAESTFNMKCQYNYQPLFALIIIFTNS